jgi:anionic cell wall polymer biosynthesis LytR-Cps2A-Psr (LCP) family protein
MALKYARSRKSTSDFDRGLRQQEILKALKEKIITSDLLQKMDVLGEIFAQLSTNIDTDISFFKALDLFQMVKDYHLDTGHILSTSNYLYSTKNAKGQYILLPLDKSYTKIQEFVLGLLND